MNRTRLVSLAALGAALALAGCKDEQPQASYGRIAEVTTPESQRAQASMSMSAGSASSQASPHNPHGSDPHGGMFSSSASAGASTGTASSMGAPGTGGMAFEPPPKVNVKQGGNILEAAGIAFTVPDGWKAEQPANAMRLAQYTLPGEGGPAELVVFYFGKGQGGSIEANIQRWAGQFSSDDPTTTTIGADVAQLERDGLRMALVKTSGTYNPGSMGPMMGGAAAEPKANYALFGLVIEGGPEGSLFVKTTGPKATMDAQAKNLEAFAQSVRPSGYK